MPQISSRPSRYKLNSWIMVDENPGPFRSRFFFGDAIKWNNHLFFHTRDLWFAKVRNRTRLCFRFIYFSPLLEFWDPTWLLRQMLSSVRNQVACSSFRIDFVGNARERSKGEKVYLPWENDPFRKFSETFFGSFFPEMLESFPRRFSNVFSAERVCLSFNPRESHRSRVQSSDCEDSTFEKWAPSRFPNWKWLFRALKH